MASRRLPKRAPCDAGGQGEEGGEDALRQVVGHPLFSGRVQAEINRQAEAYC